MEDEIIAAHAGAAKRGVRVQGDGRTVGTHAAAASLLANSLFTFTPGATSSQQLARWQQASERGVKGVGRGEEGGGRGGRGWGGHERLSEGREKNASLFTVRSFVLSANPNLHSNPNAKNAQAHRLPGPPGHHLRRMGRPDARLRARAGGSGGRHGSRGGDRVSFEEEERPRARTCGPIITPPPFPFCSATPQRRHRPPPPGHPGPGRGPGLPD